jgi:deoxycytidylate deaminase
VSAKSNVPLKGLIPIKNVEPYHKIALRTASKSPCVRRQYGAVIAYWSDTPTMITACNARVTKVCNWACVRERFGIVHGSRTELGAEVHAEQAALIEASKMGDLFVLAGWRKQEELKGTDCYPCLVCARMIKYAGYKWIYIKNEDDQIVPVSIYDIIVYREQELGPFYDE